MEKKIKSIALKNTAKETNDTAVNVRNRTSSIHECPVSSKPSIEEAEHNQSEGVFVETDLNHPDCISHPEKAEKFRINKVCRRVFNNSAKLWKRLELNNLFEPQYKSTWYC